MAWELVELSFRGRKCGRKYRVLKKIRETKFCKMAVNGVGAVSAASSGSMRSRPTS